MPPCTPIIKYPRTPHIEGSRLQKGDDDLARVPFAALRGRHLVLEEKIDGANCALSFDTDGSLLLQSRGHYLSGGARERHYDLFKQWANVHADTLRATLGSRFIVYGEWMYAKHSVYYDALPHYFMEFDIYDREADCYLDTPSRHALLRGLPICSVPVLAEGAFDSAADVVALLGPSRYITIHHLERLHQTALRLGLDADAIVRQTETGNSMEGVYIKVEEDGHVTYRAKYVGDTFTQVEQPSEQAWLARPIVPNGLSVPLDSLFHSDYPTTL